MSDGLERHFRVAKIPYCDENQFASNRIATNKYNAATFLPLNLFEQLRRLANVYFVIISILMLLGTYFPTTFFHSPLSPYSTLGPLVFVLGVTMVKEGMEDAARQRSDKEINARAIKRLLPGGGLEQVTWADLHVGDIVEVEDRGEVPADLLLLLTSEEASSCHVETSNIDGETNLKLRQAPEELRGVLQDSDQVADLAATLEYEEPNAHLYHFEGKLTAGDGQPMFLTSKSLVLRGCSIRNCKWALGVVVYTGKETKVMKKARTGPSKMSHIDITVNSLIKLILLCQVALCTISTVALYAWEASNTDDEGVLRLSYLLPRFATNPWLPEWMGQWITFLILFNNFVPISLYVSIEMVHYVQAFLINADVKMYDPETDTPAQARTSNLNEDLGQIEYMFSDKTGTLTQNSMQFKKCSVAGRYFGTPDDTSPPSAAGDVYAQLKGALEGQHGPKVATTTQQFLECMAICHTVVPEYDDDEDDTAAPAGSAPRTIAGATSASNSPLTSGGLTSGAAPAGLGAHARQPSLRNRSSLRRSAAFKPWHRGAVPSLQAESPDEGALAEAARRLGFAFVARSSSAVTIQSGGRDLVFPVLAVNEFNSTRKRMSVLFRTPSSGYLLLAKGADSTMLPRCRSSGHERTLQSHLGNFGSDGLRTLVLARRTLSAAEAKALLAKRNDTNVHPSDRQRHLDEVADEMERDMTLLGATAIEDKLQEGTPNTIRDLRAAGIKVWVLTGDKVETAVNIGFSAKLLVPDMQVITIAGEQEGGEPEGPVQRADRVTSQLHDLHATYTSLRSARSKFRVFLESVKRRATMGTSADLNLPPSTARTPAEKEEEEEEEVGGASAIHPPLRLRPATVGSSAGSSPVAASDGSGSPGTGRATAPSPTESTSMHRRLAEARADAAERGSAEDGAGGGGTRAVRSHSDPMGGSAPAGRPHFASGPGASRGASNSPGTPSPRGASTSRSPHSTGGVGDDVEASHLGLVVDGAALITLLADKRNAQRFLDLACMCKAVIACRVSPAQKAELVLLVKNGVKRKPMTLAIGDGANDVAMIQAADVGIGISGKEGLQAVNSADFAIAQFRFLKRLLLVHGRWSYRRICKVLLYSFYKNIAITLTLFYFASKSGFSGTSLYESLVYSGFNFALGLPIVAVGMLDQDLSAETAEAHPEVFVSGRLNLNLNMGKMLSWIANAFVHSIIIFWLPVLYAEDAWSDNGQEDGLLVVGTTIYTGMIMAMHGRVMLEISTWTRVHVLFLAVSVLFYYLFMVGYSQLPTYAPEFYGVGTHMLALPVHWFSVLLVTVTCFVLDLAVEFARVQFRPNMIDIAIERDRLGLPWPAPTQPEVAASMGRAASYRQYGTSKVVVGLDDMQSVVGPLSAERQRRMGVRDTSDPRYMSRGFAFSSAESGSAESPRIPHRAQSVAHGMRMHVIRGAGAADAGPSRAASAVFHGRGGVSAGVTPPGSALDSNFSVQSH